MKKVALITGASSGMGKSTANILHAQGYKVYGAARRTDKMKELEQKDSIKNVISNKIYSFKPDFIITYDAEIGGYGHPEHRISAELTEEIFKKSISNPDFFTKMIFQITLSDKLEKFLVSKSPGYELSKKLTGSKGLPQPDISVNIEKYWKVKNEAASCHQSQIKIMKRFYIVYEERNKEKHTKAFNKEYYRVVK